MGDSLGQFRRQLVDSGLMSAAEIAACIDGAESPPKSGEQLAKLLIRQKVLTIFQAQQVYNGNGKTLILGNYVLLDKLGQGGMGMVLKAEHKRMKRLVALKVMSPAAVKTPDALQRFHREVEAAAKLRHPNIVAADDADEAKGTHFLVMEYIEGSDLSALVKKQGPLPASEAVACILQAARGLEYAHEQGVVHRDIKPANLLVDSKGTVKILDMGLARFSDAAEVGTQAELTGSGTIMGTVDYMSPEQALSTKSADARSDIYSLGITLYYLLTGHPAYTGDSLMARMMAHATQPIPVLSTAVPGVSAELQAVFAKMVAKKPEDRYQSMTEVIANLETCGTNQPRAADFYGNDASGGGGSSAGLSGFVKSLNEGNASATAPTRTAPMQRSQTGPGLNDLPSQFATLYTVDPGAGCRLNCGKLEGVLLRRSCEARNAGPLSVVA